MKGQASRNRARRILVGLAIAAVVSGHAEILAKSTLATEDPDYAKGMRVRYALGEPCAICGIPLEPGDMAVQVKGRWVPLHRGACAREFEAAPAAVFAAMQPRGALFDESSHRPSPLRWGWFFAGGYVLLGLLCGALASHMAYPRGRSPGFWFGAGLAGNLVAIALLATSARPARPVPTRLGKLHDTSEPSRCAACGAGNHPSARRCLSCGAAIVPTAESEALRAARGRS